MVVTQITLKVESAYAYNVVPNIATMSIESLRKLGLSMGAVVQIKSGNKGTVARCQTGNSADKKDTIRISKLFRDCLDIDIGDSVAVRKVDAVPADKIHIAPLDKEDEELLILGKRCLQSYLNWMPLAKDSVFAIPVCYGRTMKFRVTKLAPTSAAAVVDSETKFSVDTSTVSD